MVMMVTEMGRKVAEVMGKMAVKGGREERR